MVDGKGAVLGETDGFELGSIVENVLGLFEKSKLAILELAIVDSSVDLEVEMAEAFIVPPLFGPAICFASDVESQPSHRELPHHALARTFSLWHSPSSTNCLR